MIPVTYSSAEEHLATIRRLAQPSLIVVASISEYFLEMACGVLAPALSNGHSPRRVLVTAEEPASMGAADLIFCDSCAYPVVRSLETRAEIVRHQADFAGVSRSDRGRARQPKPASGRRRVGTLDSKRR